MIAWSVISVAIAIAGEGPDGLRRDSLAAAARHVSAAIAAAVSSQDCREWAECRRLARDAAERKEYEAFHDLAWRTVQLGPKNDPALLFLLARAQSLSGRPHDALVMLRRIAASGAAREALTSADFERVRALRGWPAVEALLAPPSNEAVSSPSMPEPATAKPGASAAAPAPAVVPPAAPARPEPSTPAPGARSTAPAASADSAGAAVPFAAAAFKPSALAYDAVSRRFIVGDTDVSRLGVVDEFSRQLATLASGRSAGFGTVTAIAIDPREGDLWVASVDGASGEDVPALHRLQLISGRVLKKVAASAGAKMTSGRFADVAVAPDGAVYAIQEGGSVWRVPAGSSSLQLIERVRGGLVASAAVSSQGALFLARPDGVLRLRPLPSTEVKPADGVDLAGLVRIRWTQGSLVGVQRSADGSYRVVRVRLARGGRAAAALEVLDPSVRMPNPAAATLAGDIFYYVAETEGADLAIRRLAIK